jgi:hypothetical protein
MSRPWKFQLLLVLLALSVLPQHAGAQSGPSPSFDPDDQPNAAVSVDSVSPYNGQLGLVVPLGPAYVVGPGLAFQVRLFYSSHVWGPGIWDVFSGKLEPYMLLQGDPALGLGWRFSLGQVVEAVAGVPLAYIAADGSAHQLYDRRFYTDSSPDPGGFRYTRDGSYLRVKYLGSPTSGYEVRTPDGNVMTLAHAVTGYDEGVNNYRSDYGRGRNGFYTTSIQNPYVDAITITYQTGFPWVPYQITIPSVGGTGNRVITVAMSNSLISSFSFPVFENATATYTLTHDSSRPPRVSLDR